MIKRKLILAVFICFSLFQNHLFAMERPKWEIWTGPLASIQMLGLQSSHSLNIISIFSNHVPNLLGPSIGYILDDQFELKFSPSFSLFEGGLPYDISVLQLTAGVTYNFEKIFEQSAYVTLEAGLSHRSYSFSSQNDLVTMVSIGKRFSVCPNVSMAPQITVFDIPTLGAGVLDNILLIPVQFTIAW